MTNNSPAVAFLKLLFDPTEQPIYVSSLPNIKDDPTEPTERHLTTRDPARVDAFLHKWDRPGRGLFICVATIDGVKRNKDACVETGFLHADIDFKNVVEDEATIRERLRTLRYPPSIIVRSGNGLHCYWLFNEALQTQLERDRIEAVLRQLADLVAGDLQVAEVSRLMRLPGSHNSKGHTHDAPVWREVVMDPVTGDVRRYELSDLEEWLSETAPVLHRKVDVEETRRGWPRETNPYLEHAKLHGFKPPLDVEQALAEMAFGNIHQTQISVSASLLNAGREIDEVVDILIEATQDAAGSHGMRWNWTKERRAIRRMCESWLQKHPREAPQEIAQEEQPTQAQQAAPADNVVNLAAKRKPKPEKPAPATKPASKPAHIVIGEAMLNVIVGRDELLLFTDEGAYWYRDRLWSLLTDPVVNARLEREAQSGAIALGIEPNNRLRAEVRKYIVNHASLHRADVPWDAHGQVPTRSGLVDPRTGELTPASPDHFSTWRIDVDYDPAAQCPLWLQMLDDVLGGYDDAGRALHVGLIQEIAGAGLIDNKPKALSQALVFEGAPDTGKSGLVEVLAGLFGGEQNSTPLDQINTPHGLMQFAYRRPWVLHEAFDQNKWTLSGVVKSIITGDVLGINVKYGPQITRRFTAPILWATNHPPQFKEATAAITQRITPIKCRRIFDQRKPIGVAALAQAQGYSKPSDLVLATELPGLLAWAVAGLRRALERGSLVPPDEVLATRKAIRLDSNLVLGFIEQCCNVDADTMVSMPDFTAALSSWWLEHKGDDRKVPSSDSAGRALAALADPKIATGSELRSNSRRYIAGLRLNDEGLRHWQHAVVSDSYVFAGRRASTSDSSSDPNVAVPVAWSVKTSVIAMRTAIKVSQVSSVTDSTQDENAHNADTESATPPQVDDPPF